MGGTFLHTVLFLFSDVEHSCLPGSLHSGEILIQLKQLTQHSLLSGRGYAQAVRRRKLGLEGWSLQCTSPSVYIAFFTV